MLIGVQGLFILLLLFFMVPKFSTGLIMSACGECANYPQYDTIKIAAELGRLDIVSLCLAFLGIGFGFFAIFSFLNIKDNSISAAKQETKEYLDRYAKETFKDFQSEYEGRIAALIEAIVVRRMEGAPSVESASEQAPVLATDTSRRETEGGPNAKP